MEVGKKAGSQVNTFGSFGESGSSRAVGKTSPEGRFTLKFQIQIPSERFWLATSFVFEDKKLAYISK